MWAWPLKFTRNLRNNEKTEYLKLWIKRWTSNWTAHKYKHLVLFVNILLTLYKAGRLQCPRYGSRRPGTRPRAVDTDEENPKAPPRRYGDTSAIVHAPKDWNSSADVTSYKNNYNSINYYLHTHLQTRPGPLTGRSETEAPLPRRRLSPLPPPMKGGRMLLPPPPRWRTCPHEEVQQRGEEAKRHLTTRHLFP